MEKDQFRTLSDRGVTVVSSREVLEEIKINRTRAERALETTKILWPDHCIVGAPKAPPSPEVVDVERDARKYQMEYLTVAKECLVKARADGRGQDFGMMRHCLECAQAEPGDIGTTWNELKRHHNAFLKLSALTLLDHLRWGDGLMYYRQVRRIIRESQTLAASHEVAAITIASLGTTERELLRLRREAVYKQQEMKSWTWVKVASWTDDELGVIDDSLDMKLAKDEYMFITDPVDGRVTLKVGE